MEHNIVYCNLSLYTKQEIRLCQKSYIEYLQLHWLQNQNRNYHCGGEHILTLILYRLGICQDLGRIVLSYHHAPLWDTILRSTIYSYIDFLRVASCHTDKFLEGIRILLTYGFIWEWDVSQVTNMDEACFFKETSPDISNWNVSSVTNMNGMFAHSPFFNQPIGKWDVSRVSTMHSMFARSVSFNQPLEKWNVSSVTCMDCMFFKTTSFNQPLEKWNVSRVRSMQLMFGYAEAFNQPLAKWNVSNVYNMSYMFANTHQFNQPLAKWDVSSVLDMKGMFQKAYSFRQSIHEWKLRPDVITEDMLPWTKTLACYIM